VARHPDRQRIHPRLKPGLSAVGVNSNVVLVVEVKNKLQKRMIDSFINKRIPNFKKAFPQYNNYKLLGGIGALVVRDEVGRYAEKSGLYVLTSDK